MDVGPATANELAQVGREVGADVLENALSYPSETGSWQLGDIDLGEYNTTGRQPVGRLHGYSPELDLHTLTRVKSDSLHACICISRLPLVNPP